jgi:hypothetical protein
MTLRTKLYLGICILAATVVASAAVSQEAAAAAPVIEVPLAMMGGQRSFALILGIGALAFLYGQAWRSYRK